ncbi:hypothetical protein CBR_g88177 [Chara braunii]|uniref:Uncharacterized protein n=1 Tax=Chara braunii TaxID=69332 RepID=A0A388JK46_CHABU|nr:hypothetical protein CBR_g88177 [Chara braunii]|eukprot:GBG42468.1 hypothetical protein CBR_g88177 [Chara braunii]
MEHGDTAVQSHHGEPCSFELLDQQPFLGLQFRSTERIRTLLRKVSRLKIIPERLLSEVNRCISSADGDPIPFSVLRDACTLLKERERGRCHQGSATTNNGFFVHEVLAGSGLALPIPKPRNKSAELRQRLARLQEAADARSYEELVKDVTKNERAQKEKEFFSSYKDQLGFGLHVIVTMFTGYAFGHMLFRSQFHNDPAMNAAGGTLGLIAGMLIETLLFIIQASRIS